MIVAGVLTYATFVAALSIVLVSGYVIFTKSGRARMRARHRQAAFIAGLTSITPAPTPNKEIPLRKIIILSAAIVGALIVLAVAA